MRINLHIKMRDSNEQEHIVQIEHQSDQVTSESIKQETQKESRLPKPPESNPGPHAPEGI